MREFMLKLRELIGRMFDRYANGRCNIEIVSDHDLQFNPYIQFTYGCPRCVIEHPASGCIYGTLLFNLHSYVLTTHAQFIYRIAPETGDHFIELIVYGTPVPGMFNLVTHSDLRIEGHGPIHRVQLRGTLMHTERGGGYTQHVRFLSDNKEADELLGDVAGVKRESIRTINVAQIDLPIKYQTKHVVTAQKPVEEIIHVLVD